VGICEFDFTANYKAMKMPQSIKTSCCSSSTFDQVTGIVKNDVIDKKNDENTAKI